MVGGQVGTMVGAQVVCTARALPRPALFPLVDADDG